MSKPVGFTITRELHADWKRVLKKINPVYVGFLLDSEPKYFELMTTSFKHPVICIPHKDYEILNTMPGLLINLMSVFGKQCVSRIGGVKFIAPLEGKNKELIHAIINQFDAEVVDILPKGVDNCQD